MTTAVPDLRFAWGEKAACTSFYFG